MVTQTEELGNDIQKETPSQSSGIRENISGGLLDELISQSQKEGSIDKIEESTELEREAYKIDKDLSIGQKLNQGWTKEIDAHDKIFLQKHLGNDAYVWEIVEGDKIENEHKGEQKFNRAAVEFLGLKENLPKSYEEFLKIRGDDNINFMQKYFSKNNFPVLTGFFTPDQTFKHFHDLGILEYCRLGNGNSISIDNKGCFESLTPGHVGCSPRFGLSVHLCKK